MTCREQLLLRLHLEGGAASAAAAAGEILATHDVECCKSFLDIASMNVNDVQLLSALP